VDTMTSEKTATRKRYSKELKAQVLAECDAAGASVAKVAMAHGINANIVHGWRKLAREGGGAVIGKPLEFVPVAVAPMAMQPARERDVEIELRRGSLSMKITWPASAAADLAVWTRELLR
jgi:transposase